MPAVPSNANVIAKYPNVSYGYLPDRAWCVAPNGDDTLGDGSPAKPFATFPAANTAITKARYTAPVKNYDAILYAAGSTYSQQWARSVDNNKVVISTYGDPTKRAIINCGATGFNIPGLSDVHFMNIDLRAPDRDPEAANWAVRPGGVGFNFIRGTGQLGGAGNTLDNCCAWFFTHGVDFLCNNGQPVRFYNCHLSYNYESVNGMPVKAFGAYVEGATTDAAYNVLAGNGWSKHDDMTNPAVVQAYMFNHGWYNSAAYSPAKSISYHNLNIQNASTGTQLRTGGVLMGDIYAANGTACDGFTDGAEGFITGNLVLGTREKGLFTGGGLLGQSERQVIAGNVYLRSNPTTAPAVALGWNKPSNDMTGTTSPTATSLSTLAGNYGAYAGPFLGITSPRAYAFNDNGLFVPVGTATVLPDIIDWAVSVGYAGPMTTRGVVTWLRDNAIVTQDYATSCFKWGSAIARQLATPVQPGPIPEPVLLGNGKWRDGTLFNMVEP